MHPLNNAARSSTIAWSECVHPILGSYIIDVWFKVTENATEEYEFENCWVNCLPSSAAFLVVLLSKTLVL